MPTTFSLIASATVDGTSTSVVTFSSIPQSYTDLCLYSSVDTGGTNYYNLTSVTQNTSTSGNYTGRYFLVYGPTGPSTSSVTTAPNNVLVSSGDSTTSGVFSSGWNYFSNYTSTTLQQNVFWGGNSANSAIIFGNSRPASAAATTTLTITASGGNFVSGSTFYLYGIKNS